jgi:hypothetical protein
VHLLGRFLSICAASSGRLDAGEKWLSHKHEAMRVAVAQRHRLGKKPGLGKNLSAEIRVFDAEGTRREVVP